MINMPNPLHELLRKCTVRISTGTSGYGTGFFIAPGIILTCAHVVENYTNNRVPIPVWWEDKKCSGNISSISTGPYPDIALISADIENHPCTFLHSAIEIGDGLYTFGYSDEYPAGDSITLNYEGPTSKKDPLLKMKAGQVRPGFSGAPILNLRTGSICGVMKSTRDRSADMGGRATPISTISTLFPDLEHVQLEFHAKDKIWFNALTITQRQLVGWKETKPSVEIDLEQGKKLLEAHIEKLMAVEEQLSRDPSEGEIDFDKIKAEIERTCESIKIGGWDSNTRGILEFTGLLDRYLKSLQRQEISLKTSLEVIEHRLAQLDINDGVMLEVKQIQLQERLNKVTDLRILLSSTAIIPASLEHVPSNISETPTNQPAQLKRKIEKEKARIFNRFVSGSNLLRIGDLIYHTGLLVPFKWSRLGSKTIEKETAIDYILSGIRSGRFLILSNPGVGKSTLTYKIFNDISNIQLEGKRWLSPIHIDLRDYLGDPEFGEREWMDKFLDQWLEEDLLAEDILMRNERKPLLEYFIILDSLDEFLANLTISEITSVLNRYIFQIANIVTCRSQFYDRYLSMSNFSAQFGKINLLPWDVKDWEQYVTNYFHFCYPESDEQSIELSREKIRLSPQLQELSHVPLHLNMILDVLPNTQFVPESIEDLLALYNAYLHNWLSREASKGGSILDVDEKFQLLEEISWYFYDEGRIGEISSLRFSISETRNFLQERPSLLFGYNVNDVIRDLCFRSILLTQPLGHSDAEVTSIRFIHKSFQEFFIARYLYHCVTRSGNAAAVAFRKPISPEVSEFLKQFKTRINRSPQLLEIAVKNFITAIKLNTDPLQTSEISPARTRISRQHLCYHLGSMRSVEASKYLRELLRQLDDLWTKRGIIIGLSFGGDDDLYHSYISHLREMRTTQGDSAENTVNIGTQLSFFGDQPYDILNPDVDQGLPKCESTIRKLVHQMGTEIDRGSWRLDLFTIIDLFYYREVSKENARTTILEKEVEIKTILNKLKKDHTCNWWPEINEMEAVLDGIHKS